MNHCAGECEGENETREPVSAKHPAHATCRPSQITSTVANTLNMCCPVARKTSLTGDQIECGLRDLSKKTR